MVPRKSRLAMHSVAKPAEKRDLGVVLSIGFFRWEPERPRSRSGRLPLRTDGSRKLPPLHPGEILLEEFLTPLSISQYRLAKETSVPPRRINEIVAACARSARTPPCGWRAYFGTSERFWLNLQTRYDLEVEKDRLGDRFAAR